MAEPSKIGYLLERLAQGVAAHDRENPGHHTWGIGMTYCIEELSSGCASSSSARRAAGSMSAPSAIATAAASLMHPTSAARHSGWLRMKPMGRSEALVVQARAFRRTSFDHRICASPG